MSADCPDHVGVRDFIFDHVRVRVSARDFVFYDVHVSYVSADKGDQRCPRIFCPCPPNSGPLAFSHDVFHES